MDRRYLVFMALGFELLGLTVAAIFLGDYTDHRGWSRGWGVVIAPVVAMVGWLIHAVALAQRLDREG